MDAPKVPKYAYSLMWDKCLPDKHNSFWEALADFTMDSEDSEEIHLRNFKCSISSQLRSFLKFFHDAIAFNDFLFKINRKNSPNCAFCDKVPETVSHVFVIVILLNLFGRRLFRLLKPNTTLTLICQPLINFLVCP